MALILSSCDRGKSRAPECSRNGEHYFIRDRAVTFLFQLNATTGVKSAAIIHRSGILGASKGAVSLNTLKVEHAGLEWIVRDAAGEQLVATTDQLCGDAVIAAIAHSRELQGGAGTP